jgi:transcriptional regulator with XRE-family HTH domain
MSSSASIHMAQLPNYLRSNRKRLALSQEEVAFLLGTQSGAKVCRYERFAREPSLATALAFEVIFQRPASELFGGLYQKVQQEVATRAKTLAYRTDRGKFNRQTAHKCQILTSIANKSLNQ